MSDEDINDEVLFWQKLIEWWKSNKDESCSRTYVFGAQACRGQFRGRKGGFRR